MWISDEYYNELVNSLKNLSNGNFDFNEENLKKFNTSEYQNITAEIIKIKSNTNNHITNSINYLDNLIDGNYSKINHNVDIYKEIYDKYNVFVENLDQKNIEARNDNWIKDGVSTLIKAILHKDNIEDKLDIVINSVCEYIEADKGAIYIYNSIDDVLVLEGAKNREIGIISDMKDGSIAQVANDKKSISTFENGMYNYRFPILCNHFLVGVVEIEKDNDFSQIQIKYIKDVFSLLSTSFYNDIQIRNNEKLNLMYKTDNLTGLYNKKYFNQLIPEMINREKRTDGFVCLAILDIDYFKKFNDRFGHEIGDKILISISEVLKLKAARHADKCFRIDGDKFALIFSANDKMKAFFFMNSIKDTIENLKVLNEERMLVDKVTVSIGLTCKRSNEINNFKDLYDETERLLIKAKEKGRNKIVASD